MVDVRLVLGWAWCHLQQPPGPGLHQRPPPAPGRGPHDTAAALDTCYTAPCPAHLPRPPSSGLRRAPWLGDCEASVRRLEDMWQLGWVAMATPGTIHNTHGDTSSALPASRLHTSPVSGDTQMSELTVLIILRSKANESNLLSCDAMINDVYTIVCSVPEEFCIGNKAVSLAL